MQVFSRAALSTFTMWQHTCVTACPQPPDQDSPCCIARWQEHVLGALASARAAAIARAVQRTLQPHRVSRALARAIRRAQPRMASVGATAISVLSATNARFAPTWVHDRFAKARKTLTDGYPPCPRERESSLLTTYWSESTLSS